MSTGTKRLIVEFANLIKQEEKAKKDGVELPYRVWQKNGSVTHWGAKIRGPPDTSHAGGIYVLDIKFPDKYPFSPPNMNFMTKLYHPNVSDQGAICLDILKSGNGKWSAALKVEKVLISLISFLADPNPDDPLNGNVASVYRKDKAEYESKVREYRDTYCTKTWENDE